MSSRRTSICSELDKDSRQPEIEDVKLDSGKVVRIRRKFHDPNPSEDPLWQKYRLQTFQSYIGLSAKNRRRRRSEPPLLLNFDYLEEAQDQRNGLIQYDPTVPLPAFYDPPDEREELFYPPRNPSHPRLYPLLTIQTHPPNEYQSLEPNQIFTVHDIPKNEVVRDEKPCCDVRALKIGACIVLIFVVAVGAFVGYIVYNKKPQV